MIHLWCLQKCWKFQAPSPPHPPFKWKEMWMCFGEMCFKFFFQKFKQWYTYTIALSLLTHKFHGNSVTVKRKTVKETFTYDGKKYFCFLDIRMSTRSEKSTTVHKIDQSFVTLPPPALQTSKINDLLSKK